MKCYYGTELEGGTVYYKIMRNVVSDFSFLHPPYEAIWQVDFLLRIIAC